VIGVNSSVADSGEDGERMEGGKELCLFSKMFARY
jgi:hypothetical protein